MKLKQLWSFFGGEELSHTKASLVLPNLLVKVIQFWEELFRDSSKGASGSCWFIVSEPSEELSRGSSEGFSCSFCSGTKSALTCEENIYRTLLKILSGGDLKNSVQITLQSVQFERQFSGRWRALAADSPRKSSSTAPTAPHFSSPSFPPSSAPS